MSRKIRVLLVDDDSLFRRVVREELSASGFDTTSVADGKAALKILKESDYDVTLLDIQMAGLSGLDTLREMRELEDPPEVIMLTADTSLASGLEAMRLGAYDYLTKPSTLDEMEAVIRKADEKRRLVRQNASLRAAVPAASGPDREVPAFVFASAEMQNVIKLAEAAAPLDSTVLITGESGTGKDVVARHIHARSQRSALPIITLNCGAVPESLFESEFFGHERGAFTGADTTRHGLVEAADGSTLFLDEIGDMPLQMQVKLLHFLEQGRFRRVGTTRDQNADVRVIAATNRDLLKEIERGSFRADLFYRLNVVSLHIPPLRERPEAIPALIDHYLNLFRERFKRPDLNISEAARVSLQQYSWPGNVRELRNSLERAAALSTSNLIDIAHISVPVTNGRSTAPTATNDVGALPPTLDDLERRHIETVLNQTGGNRERAAAILGISSRTLYRKLREYESKAGPNALATEA
jgi:DNA-binding NtrC family response regulator